MKQEKNNEIEKEKVNPIDIRVVSTEYIEDNIEWFMFPKMRMFFNFEDKFFKIKPRADKNTNSSLYWCVFVEACNMYKEQWMSDWDAKSKAKELIKDYYMACHRLTKDWYPPYRVFIYPNNKNDWNEKEVSWVTSWSQQKQLPKGSV